MLSSSLSSDGFNRERVLIIKKKSRKEGTGLVKSEHCWVALLVGERDGQLSTRDCQLILHQILKDSDNFLPLQNRLNLNCWPKGEMFCILLPIPWVIQFLIHHPLRMTAQHIGEMLYQLLAYSTSFVIPVENACLQVLQRRYTRYRELSVE